MATPISTPLATLLPVIAAQVAATTTITSNRILLVTDDRIPKFQGDQDVLIYPGTLICNPDFSAAVGRFACIVTRELNITLRTRFGVDMSDRSDYWITDPTYGHYVFEEAIVAGLDTWLPEDGNHNTLLEEPIHYLNTSKPQQSKTDRQWGETTLTFSIMYQIPMSQTI